MASVIEAGWKTKNNTAEAQEKCITRLLLYHFCVNLPVMLASYPVFRFMGMRSSLPLPSWYATPFGLTSEYAHPAEILFLGFATIFGPAITGPHLITLWLWMVVRVLETVEAHCGYHFPWSPSNFLPLYGGIFGTDNGYRKLKALKSEENLFKLSSGNEHTRFPNFERCVLRLSTCLYEDRPL
ncbi:hypothetical protein Ccrd_018068 [Cynara cardunculus var. scolymus]|uniref:Uncharacterized protein n=1 Tax=Cynara cardunculus var. scolymus TaxID=59895 RepID=A0A124SFL7_CYNCS|nr:hypothetical protein Ccrd_018068 [Cynara cardunculus var. scolymus]